MEFFDRNWTLMGSRAHLAGLISQMTGIEAKYFTEPGSKDLSFRSASVATRMSWMAGRTTSAIEDIAYSMLGIFDINLIPQYGEGVKAFMRLQEAIMAEHSVFDESLFAWNPPSNGALRCFRRQQERPRSPSQASDLIPTFEQSSLGLLAPSPDCFRVENSHQLPREVSICQDNVVHRQGTGFLKTHQGVNITLPLKDTKKTFSGRDKKKISLALNCWVANDNVVVDLVKNANGSWMRTTCEARRGARVGDNKVLKTSQGSALLVHITVSQPQVQLKF